MTGRDHDAGDLLVLLEDEYARDILIATRDTSLSAPTLADELDASRSTIYRRVERLQNHDLLEVSQQLDPDGHHREVYRARLERVTFKLTSDGFTVAVDRTEPADPGERFATLYEELAQR